MSYLSTADLLLTTYAGPDIARRAAYLWWALSRAGHHHHYELGLTAPELLRLRTDLVQLIGRLRAASVPAGGVGRTANPSGRCGRCR